MPAPVFTNTESEITRLEGLYIMERTPPAEIIGVSLNDVVVISEAIRGPVNEAVLCSSPARVKEVFGGRDQGSGGITTSPLWRTLLNKPFSRVWVVRCAAAAAVKATANLPNGVPTNIVRVDASSVGAWGNNISVEVKAASDGDANHWNLEYTYLGVTKVLKNLNTNTSADDNLLATLGDDKGLPIALTKLANGRPVNGVVALTTGADGSIADSDFTGTGKGIDVAAAVQDVGCVWIAERMSSTLKNAVETKAASTPDRMWFIGPDAETTSAATAITDAGNFRDPNGRIVYTYGHCYTLDPEAGAEILVRPESWLASIFSQTDPDIHVGEEDTKQYTAGIIRLYNQTFVRGDYIAFKDAGICALENDAGGFAFVSGVTTCLNPGKEQIARRRCTDYLLISLARDLKHQVKKKNTTTRRAVIAGLIDSFLNTHKQAERIVEDYELKLDGAAGNTSITRSQNIERFRLRVRLIPHMLHLVLEGEVGTNVTITEAAA
jgi:hypothetical protein